MCEMKNPGHSQSGPSMHPAGRRRATQVLFCPGPDRYGEKPERGQRVFVLDRCRKGSRPEAEPSYRILHILSYGRMGTVGSASVNEGRVDRRAKTHFLEELGSLLEGERTPDLTDPILPDRYAFSVLSRGKRVCEGTRGYAFV